MAQSAEGQGGQPRGQCEAELNQVGHAYNTLTSQTHSLENPQPFPFHGPRSSSLQPEHWPSTHFTAVQVGT